MNNGAMANSLTSIAAASSLLYFITDIPTK